DLFRDQQQAFQTWHEAEPDLPLAWHWLTTPDEAASGFNALFATSRREQRPAKEKAQLAIEHLLSGRACLTHGREILVEAEKLGWSLAYALAWLSVSGGNSVVPPWVRNQFPGAGVLVRRLRDIACGDSACAWCIDRHDARKELVRWFGFSEFRSEPA